MLIFCTAGSNRARFRLDHSYALARIIGIGVFEAYDHFG